MKTSTRIVSATLLLGALSLTAPNAGAVSTIPAQPTLTATTTAASISSDVVTFSGSDYCGPTTLGLPYLPRGSMATTCGHDVFVGLWAPDPEAEGGNWIQSTTVLSSPGGVGTSLSNMGTIPGTFTLTCGSPEMQIFAFDITAGTWVSGPMIPAVTCAPHIHPIPGG